MSISYKKSITNVITADVAVFGGGAVRIRRGGCRRANRCKGRPDRGYR